MGLKGSFLFLTYYYSDFIKGGDNIKLSKILRAVDSSEGLLD